VVGKPCRTFLLAAISFLVSGTQLSCNVGVGHAGPARNYGFQLRIRQVFLETAIDLNDMTDDETHFFRIRSALWGRVRPTPNTEIYARLNNEFRRYLRPDTEFEIDEVIFETLYVRWTDMAGLPLDLTVGRQNIMLGEGFLVMDGGPLDGSRTNYQNGARLTWRTRSQTIDFLAISNPAHDEYLPVINDQDRMLVESDERLVGVHLSCTRVRGLEFQPYYFYKEEDPRTGSPHHLKLHTPGARLAYQLTAGVKIVAEAAVQRGDRCGEDVSAFGGYGYVEKRSPSSGEGITLGMIHLSGKKKGTVDPWNPLLSRWPKWSELYIYTLIREDGVAYWQNFGALFLKLDAPFRNRGVFSACVYRLTAHEPRLGFFPSHHRGWLLESQLRLRLHPGIKGHLLAEVFLPGDFYAEAASWGPFPADEPKVPETAPISTKGSLGFGMDRAVFLRWELLFDF